MPLVLSFKKNMLRIPLVDYILFYVLNYLFFTLTTILGIL